MGRKRSALSALGVLAVALTLVGCANSALSLVQPKPTAPSTSAAPSAAAADCLTSPNLISACTRLGDLTTLDPCSLLTLSELPPDLNASPTPRNSLDYCTFDITAGPDKDVVLQLGELGSVSNSTGQGPSRFDAGGRALQPAGLDLQLSKLHDGQCDDALQFEGDLVDLDINVFVTDGAGSQSLCDAAGEVGTALAKVLGGTTQMQHFPVSKNSIAKLKACTLLDGAQVGTYTVGGSADSPSGHGCVWTPDPTNYNIELGIGLEFGTRLDSQVADATSQIHGFPTYTIKGGTSDYSRCDVATNRAPWGSPGNGLVEIVSVWATGDPGQIDAACALATQMANIVWPKLPPIS